MAYRRLKSIKICIICKKQFHPCRKKQLCCSHLCGTRLRLGKTSYQKIKVKCKYCNKEMLRKPSRIKKNKTHYCSVQCYWLHQKETMKGKNNPNYKNGGMKKNCLTCNTEFTTYHKNKKYCSHKCARTINLKGKGARYERQAKKELQEQGYTVTRSSASLGVFDLIAFNNEKLRLIQIKSTMNLKSSIEGLYKKDLTQMQEVESPPNSVKELWCWRNRKGWEKKCLDIKNGH